MSAQHTPGPWRGMAHWRMPGLVAADAKPGDHVLCTNGASTGFLRRGREYVIEHVAPSGYIRVEGSADYYHAAARFTAITKAEWCEQCGVDVYTDGKCSAFGCGHIKGAAIAKATGSAA